MLAVTAGCQPAADVDDLNFWIQTFFIMAGKERFTRRNLPHWYKPGFAHFVTYRQAGTIPLSKLQEWRADRDTRWRQGPPEGVDHVTFRDQLQKQFFNSYDTYLDTQSTQSDLTNPDVAAMLRENLYHHAGSNYELLAWCIMSNHVHVVLQPFELTSTNNDEPGDHRSAIVSSGDISDTASPLSRVMHQLKSYTANRANAILGRKGRFWQPESYDHWVRDLDELERIVAYVIHNPVKAGLCTRPTEWRFSSAYDRFQRDGSESGLVGRLRDDWLR